MTIRNELTKPTLTPLQLRPVQASDHAFSQGSNVRLTGRARIDPPRISDIGLSEVTSIV